MALMVATVAFEDDHVTCVVRLITLPSLNVPVAVKFTGVPCGTIGLAGAMVIPLVLIVALVRRKGSDRCP